MIVDFAAAQRRRAEKQEFADEIAKAAEAIWQCNCGATHFRVTWNGDVVCTGCTVVQVFPWSYNNAR